MSKSWRFIKHFLGCFVIVEQGFFRVWRLVSLIGPVALATVPWFVGGLSRYAAWLCAFGIAWLLLRAFWHSFALYDDLNEKAKRRLKINNADPVDNRHGFNRVYPIKVTNLSSSDVEECSGTLTRIVHNGVEKWGNRRADLTFQPAERSDRTSKTIRPQTTQYLDVLFLEFRAFTAS
jgi:hypothetical protein